MFDDPHFLKYDFERVPLDRDIFVMDEAWINDYEAAWSKFFRDQVQFDPVGYVGYAAARAINENAIELSWYTDIIHRFHEVRILLPREHFITCIGIHDYDSRPVVFATSEWYRNQFRRLFSVFALVDAAGVKAALAQGVLTREKLITLRAALDEIASRNPDMSFISFADSVLLKSNWHSGDYERGVAYNYEPENTIKIIAEIQVAFRETLGLEIYAVVGQGSNEYYEDSLLHISEPHRNHVSLNSLGLPFAQISEIDRVVRAAIRDGGSKHELYMDSHFFFSLKFNHEFTMGRHSLGSAPYKSPMITGESRYFVSK